jgi:hypothetical protein
MRLVLVLVVLALGAIDAMAACYKPPPCGCKNVANNHCGGITYAWCYVDSDCSGATWDPFSGYTMSCTELVACINCSCRNPGEITYVDDQFTCGYSFYGNTCECSASCPKNTCKTPTCKNWVAPTRAPVPAPTRAPVPAPVPTTSRPTMTYPPVVPPVPVFNSQQTEQTKSPVANVPLIAAGSGIGLVCLVLAIGVFVHHRKKQLAKTIHTVDVSP